MPPASPLTVVPDGHSRLSDGVIIETSVLARLLGIKLLTLEGTVLVSPAQLQEAYQAYATTVAAPAAVETPREIRAERLNGGSPTRSGPSGAVVGARLDAAARLLGESSRDLHSIERRP